MRLVLLLRKEMVALHEEKTAAVAAMGAAREATREAVGKETAAREALIEAERVRSPQPAAAAEGGMMLRARLCSAPSSLAT